MADEFDQAAMALSHIPSDDREIWVRMGMALKASFGESARDIWIDWSSSSSAFNLKTANAVWRSFKRSGRVTLGSLFHEAGLNGFVREAPVRREFTQEEIAARRADRVKAEAEDRHQRECETARAQRIARNVWRQALKAGDSPYLDQKQVMSESIRFLPGGEIVIPMIRYDLPRESALMGVQTITRSGEKRFTAGMNKSGTACRLGLVDINAPILICEGYATGGSIRMAINYRLPVFVAFDVGNLVHVVAMLRDLYPGNVLLICADDDWRTRGNPGRTVSRKICKATERTHMIYPVFRGARGAKDTDFNDLHRIEGITAVMAQFSTPLRYMNKNERGGSLRVTG